MAIIPGTKLSYGPESEPSEPTPDDIEEARWEAAKAVQLARAATERFRELAERVAETDNVSPEGPKNVEVTLADLDQAIAQAERERRSEEIRRATVTTYSGGVPPKARGAGEPEPTESDRSEPSKGSESDIERYTPTGGDSD